MENLKSVYIKIKNPNLKQKIIIITANFMLWLVVKLFEDDKEKMKNEIKDIIIETYKAL